MAKSGYFELDNRTDGLYLKIHEAETGGYNPSFEDLVHFCDAKKVPYDSIVQLKTVFDTAHNDAVRVSDCITPFSGWCESSISTDGMKVTAVLYPPTSAMSDADEAEIRSGLASMKIRYGLIEENIRRMVQEKLYFVPVIVAAGTEAVEGYDAELTYNFSTTVSNKPQVNDDGTVDFHKLDLINKVNAGDVVAQIKPEYSGENGMDVYGNVIKPKKVYRKIFKYGRNLKVSDDGLQLISLVTGHVKLENDKVFVSDEYEISADVDTATGDIDFDGNVHIKGNVLAGFKVKASGNVVVDGVVEGAEITAGGNIILQRGIQGMNKGVLTAGGNIASNFIENARVIAGKDIDTDAIMHSKVTARGNIEIHGRNGYLIGGFVRAGNLISAKTIGSDMGTNTIIGVGSDPELLIELDNIMKQINKESKDKAQLSQLISLLRRKQDTEGKLEPDKVEMFQKAMKNMILLDNSINKQKNEYNAKSELLVENKDARIKVNGSIYPGVKIEIGDISLFIRDKNNFCQYVLKDGEVTRINL